MMAVHRFIYILIAFSLSNSASANWQLGSELRGFSLNFTNTSPFLKDEQSLGQLWFRLKPHVQWKSGAFEVFVQPQITTILRAYGSSPLVEDKGFSTPLLDLQQGFVVFEITKYADFTFGRQEFFFGQGKRLGQYYQTPSGLSFDSARLDLFYDLNKISLFFAPVRNEDRLENIDLGSSFDFYGIYYEIKANPKMEIDLYFFENRKVNLKSSGKLIFYTLGSHLIYDPSPTWFFRTEYSVQFVEAPRNSLGGDAALEIGTHLQTKWQNRISINLSMASANYFPLYPSDFSYNGEANFFANKNIISAALKNKVRISDQVDTLFSANLFYRQNTSERLVNVKNQKQIDGANLNNSNRYIGSEFDLSISYRRQKTLLESGLGIFRPGSYFVKDNRSGVVLNLWLSLSTHW